MALQDAQAKLARATKDLLLHWRHTRETWRDARAEQVGGDLVEPLTKASKAAVEAMAGLGEAVNRARRECGRR